MHYPTQGAYEKCEKYAGGFLVAPMDDFERFQMHEILRALSSQLYRVSTENVALSKREKSGDVLSPADCSRRTNNRVRMGQIEDLIKTTSKSLILERA